MKKHQDVATITVLCLAGKAVFKAGDDLAEEVNLEAGPWFTQESNVGHEIIAKTGAKTIGNKI